MGSCQSPYARHLHEFIWSVTTGYIPWPTQLDQLLQESKEGLPIKIIQYQIWQQHTLNFFKYLSVKKEFTKMTIKNNQLSYVRTEKRINKLLYIITFHSI